ncbi:glycosyl hydrolase family 65 protein [Pseudarthrobacter sp. NPDC092419]|uniref:glycosyl hydrolase family 65 protein n=1 Tax=Pseudarthrobacter sp. NPDC092419 TaxID=3364414 RepID=UPI003829E04C
MSRSPTAAAAKAPFDAVIFATKTGTGAETELLERLRGAGTATAFAPGAPARQSAREQFLAAAGRLGVAPPNAVVIGDSVEDILAAHEAGFGLVVAIDRGGGRPALEAAGAGVVLNHLGELDLGRVAGDPWQLAYEGFDAAHEGHREALTTLGNGYLAVRGAAPEGSGGASYPGMYLAGVFNRVPTNVAGEVLLEEHMVNAPDCLPLDLRAGGGRWWSEGGMTVLRERRTLDLRRAVLVRRLLLDAGDDRQLEVVQRRFVSMAEPHLLALETAVTAVGWSGTVEVRSGVNAGVRNANLPDPAGGSGIHLVDVTPGAASGGAHAGATTDGGTFDGGHAPAGGGVAVVEVETTQSRVRIAVATATSVSAPHGNWAPGRDGSFHYLTCAFAVTEATTVRITKVVAVVTSRDHAVSSPASGALAVLDRAGMDFGGLLAGHLRAWTLTLKPFLVELDAPAQVQLVLNLHIFHVLQTLTRHTAELDAGVTARGLHGEGYRGHVFWDELFVLPLLASRTPDVARALIEYRWRRLPAARHAAALRGHAGAMFPWQSGSDGTETTPKWLYNGSSGRWMRDHSHMQLHVGLAVAFNAWQYFQVTRDLDWLLRKGADLIVEVARFFTSWAVFSAASGRYHLNGVVGPDEYHTGYPGRNEPGLDDNAYTNVMAAWVCGRAVETVSAFPEHVAGELRSRLGIGRGEVARWREMAATLYVPFHGDGVISQFAGYADLTELDWDVYRARYESIERLDLILEAEGDATNGYKLAKQADVLMLPYLLGHEGLIQVLQGLGYTLTMEQLHRTIEYYLARTAHGSTLSRVAHASVLAGVDPERAWESFREALDADLDDTQHGTTRAGIHLGAMAGTIDVIQRSFAGLRLDGDTLVFEPSMPAGIGAVAFGFRYRNHVLVVRLQGDGMRLASAAGDAGPVAVRVNGTDWLLAPGEDLTFRIPGQRRPTGGEENQ